jgi:hypothetical protein
MMPTVFGLLLVCLKAHFNLHRGDRRNLIRTMRTHTHIGGSGWTGLEKKTSYLVRTAHGLCLNFRQTNVVELSFLDHFIEHLHMLLNLILRVAPRRFEQIELLCPTQSFEDVIYAPA